MLIPAALIESLREIDTPTVCNALELIDPSRRTTGFNRLPLYQNSESLTRRGLSKSVLL